MIVLVTGGSASGKSGFAEHTAAQMDGNRIYVATMHKDGQEETTERIQKHQRQRAEYGFATIERELDIEGVEVPENSTVLVECLSNLMANEIFLAGLSKKEAEDKIFRGLVALSERAENLVMVTNEIFSDGCRYDETVLAYIEALAGLNRRLAQMADCVVEVVYSIPVFIKGEIK